MKIFFAVSAAALTIWLVSCTQSNKRFTGKHNFQIPIATLYKDTSEVFYDFGMKSYPSIIVDDLYPGELELSEQNDILKGVLRFKTPENTSMFNSKTKTVDKTVELTDVHDLNDTLYFSLGSSGKSGIAFINEKGLVIGLPNDLFHIKPSSCSKTVLYNFADDVVYFKTAEPADNKTFYSCQLDSLKREAQNINEESEKKNNNRMVKFLEAKLR